MAGGCRRSTTCWNPALKGKVEVLSEMRDTVGLIMLPGQGHLRRLHRRRVHDALDELQKQLDSGQIRQVKGNSYKEDLISGDALPCIAWSGDIIQLNAENDDKSSSPSPSRAARCGRTT